MRAVSTGNYFGVVCHGTDTVDPEPLPFCPNVAVLYTKLDAGLAGYEMYYTTDSVRADKIFLRTRFDAPVLSISPGWHVSTSRSVHLRIRSKVSHSSVSMRSPMTGRTQGQSPIKSSGSTKR